eukprot:scaffold39048_cov70-Phaeocystis_antarctica.AAC.3
MAWKAKLADEKRARINTEQQRFRATPTPLPGGAHGSTRVAWDHATHAPAPQPQFRAAPPAPQLVVGQEDPAAPHWIELAVTDGMLRVGQIILERSDGEALCFALPPDARPGQCLIVNLPPDVAHGQTLRVHCQPPPAPCQPLLHPPLPPFPPMSLQTLSQPAAPTPAAAVPPKPLRRAPELRYLPLELLTAAASHRTDVEHYLDHQQQLAEVNMEDQITEEEAIEIAISLGMSRRGGDDNFGYL